MNHSNLRVFVAFATLIASPIAIANDHSAFGGGFIGGAIGTALLGPMGTVLGASIGAWMGYDLDDPAPIPFQPEQKSRLMPHHAHRLAGPNPSTINGLIWDIRFINGSSALNPQQQRQINQLAHVMHHSSTSLLHIEAYPTPSAPFLAQHRIACIKHQLMNHGVPANQITSQVHHGDAPLGGTPSPTVMITLHQR